MDKTCPEMGPREIKEISTKAYEMANSYWRHTSVKERIEKVFHLGTVIDSMTDEIADTMEKELDKPPMEIHGDEISITLSAIEYCVKNAKSILERHFRLTSAQKKMIPGRELRVFQRPKGSGVVMVQTPWNVPFQIPITDAVEVLVSGNVPILKPSEYTPAINDLIYQIIIKAGLEDVFFMVRGGKGASQHLLHSLPKKSHVTFTGSPDVATIIQRACLERDLYCHIEGGGLDAMLVFLDGNSSPSLVKRAVQAAVNGRFRNSGRNCNSVKLVVIVGKDEAFANQFTIALAKAAGNLRAGVDYGKFIMPYRSPQHLDFLKAQLREAKEKGAHVSTGNYDAAMAADEYFPPVVLCNVTKDMCVVSEETFGPVLPVFRVSTEDEAIDLVNNLEYSLDTYIFTENEKHGYIVAEKLKTGNICINDALINYAFVQMPFSGGGEKSGYGSRHGSDGILKYTRPQTVVITRAPFLMRALPPTENHWFPYDGNIELFGLTLPVKKLTALKLATSRFVASFFRSKK